MSALNAPAELWASLEAAARTNADAVAVRDADTARTMTYRELFTAAAAQSAALSAAGVTSGDVVAVTARRSPREVIAVLAVLRLGAAYSGIDPDLPRVLAADALDRAGVRVVLGDGPRLAAFAELFGPRRVVRIGDGIGEAGPVAAVSPHAAACVVFTSGALGPVEAVRIDRASITRLAGPGGLLHLGIARVARLSGLAEPAAAVEILAPLLAGGTVEVFPGAPRDPETVARFVAQRRINALWLPAGLLRQIGEFRPDALRSARQAITGGGPVPREAVRRLLRAAPGLCVTTVAGLDEPGGAVVIGHAHHADDVADPPPVADADRVVVHDRVVHRSYVAVVLGTHPLVRDAAVTPAPGGRLLAAVVLAEPAFAVAALREFLAERLPPEAVPELWVAVDAVPRTVTGSVDTERLVDLATAADPVRRLARGRRGPAPAGTGPDRTGEPDAGDPLGAEHAERVVRAAWQKALGHDDFGRDDEFFDVGGTSVHLLEVRAQLRLRLPSARVGIDDLYAHPTIASLSGHIVAAGPDGGR
ncbi:non-ribosomal peptide synthetase [Dactylosporangium sp. CA-233914]|uniref:non-ribosomal peptide synthetase n=1 Tax=Dactylosporangium sp. CA-233914 TaxID=3239934 RepID=UPI003D901F65